MKKQDKDKKVVKAKKGQEQTEETRRVAKKSSPPGSGVTQGTLKGKRQETAKEQDRPAVVSSGPLMPKVEGKLVGRTGPGERSVVPAKPGEEKPALKTGATAHPGAANRETAPGLSKQYSASRSLCKVTFRLPAAAAPAAKKVTIVGDFNDWNKETTSLKRQDNGDFAVTLDLDAGREYRFRYLIDGQRWENDWRADKYVSSPYGGDDSVVSV